MIHLSVIQCHRKINLIVSSLDLRAINEMLKNESHPIPIKLIRYRTRPERELCRSTNGASQHSVVRVPFRPYTIHTYRHIHIPSSWYMWTRGSFVLSPRLPLGLYFTLGRDLAPLKDVGIQHKADDEKCCPCCYQEFSDNYVRLGTRQCA